MVQQEPGRTTRVCSDRLLVPPLFFHPCARHVYDSINVIGIREGLGTPSVDRNVGSQPHLSNRGQEVLTDTSPVVPFLKPPGNGGRSWARTTLGKGGYLCGGGVLFSGEKVRTRGPRLGPDILITPSKGVRHHECLRNSVLYLETKNRLTSVHLQSRGRSEGGVTSWYGGGPRRVVHKRKSRPYVHGLNE